MSPDGEEDASAPARAGLTGILLISAAALAVFAGTLRYPYLYDDVTEIRENSRVHRLDAIPSLLTTEFVYGVRGKGFVYRPVTAATIPPLVVAGRGSPEIFHVANILLHAFISVMLAVVLARLWRRRFPALAAGLLFAVLPIHTEAVAWISGRSELLQAAAGMAAWYCHLLAREGKKRWAAAGAWLLLAVALGAKESAVAWPFLFFLGDRLFPPESAPAAAAPGRRFRAGLYLSYGVLLAMWVGARFAVLGQLGRRAAEGAPLLNPLEGLPWLPYRPFTTLRLLFVAAWKSLAPGAPSIDYGFDQIPVAARPFHADVVAGAILLAIFVALLLVALLRRSCSSRVKRLALASGIFLLFWFPVSSLLLASVSIFAERNLYLPSLAFCIAAATAAEWIRRRFVPARWAAAVGLAVIAGTGLYAASRNAAYADPISLYASTTRACPASARAHFLLAGALGDAGRLDEATAECRQALAIAPGYVDARGRLATFLAASGHADDARREARRALAAGSARIGTRLIVSEALAAAGLTTEAEGVMRDLEREYPDDPRIAFSLGQFLSAWGRTTEALSVFEKMSRQYPGSPAGPAAAATVRIDSGDLDAARGLLAEALGRDPYDTSALYNAGLVNLREEPRTVEAARQAERFFGGFLRIEPLDPLAWLRRGEALARLGRIGDAERDMRRAVALAPGNRMLERSLDAFLARRRVAQAAAGPAGRKIR